MALKPVSVSQLNDYISRIIGTDPLLGAVVVKGEISNLKYHSSGHVYFSIIDKMSKINCFLPFEYAYRMDFQMEDGMEVILTGAVNVYKKNGTYSLNVRNVELSGAGNLAAAFEKMKAKLKAEGLFDQDKKKPIPTFPKKIGIVTSATGAAVKDILKILKGRNNLVDVIIFPVLVQGTEAAADISAMIDFVNANYTDIDTLIVGRGGGSADDLWAFNEEIVARSIYNSRIPVISAVGHEIDFTISDMVADVRAETPTAAAQMAVPDIRDVRERLEQMNENLYVQLSNKIMFNRLLIDNLKEQSKNTMLTIIDRNKTKIETAKVILEENNPVKIMENGFSVLTDENNRIISSVNSLAVDSTYTIKLKDGSADCVITGIGSKENEQ